ncbi:hypothetical protein SAMN05216315_10720 [Nitrosospira sp. Nsp18]|nr:hypothetical protein SAMN05216315_10720 [Nitrosospira sp. Nsp18]
MRAGSVTLAGVDCGAGVIVPFSRRQNNDPFDDPSQTSIIISDRMGYAPVITIKIPCRDSALEPGNLRIYPASPGKGAAKNDGLTDQHSFQLST